ncbi:MAG: AAA family ATPase [Candidatus Tectomicrobia bacterium]|uniref:AAA family ATPase n=1 Tax=Tectimicrobiota bacterium TaxID=2528274 RepID=A0A932CMT5_UNCTE|nr:AAA family ATPase [Candidatus Tectomicrobia bacterium]
MYEEHWSLKELPFENVPDPRFFYTSTEHEEALLRLRYAISRRKGAIMLTGEVGCGKTLLSRVLTVELAEGSYEIALIPNPTMNPSDLIREILYQLGREKSSSSKAELLESLNDELLKNMERGKETIIIVDEAQAIEDTHTLEELRLLLNFQLNDRFLMTLTLIGQPELRGKIKRIPQLDQRIAIRYHLRPLSLEETARYIHSRLQVAGGSQEIFKQEAIDLVYSYTQGVPRKINNVCDMALLVGYSARANQIDERILSNVIEEFK